MFRLSPLVKLIGAAAIALVLGLGSAWFSILGAVQASGVTNGPWFTSLAIGSAASDPYTRAQIAVTGLLALNKSEAVYFTAAEDGEGRPLRGSCDYRISGRNMAARWWSLTAYGADNFLIANEAGRYSYNVASLGLRFAPIARWEITASARPQEGNWLPVAEGDLFSLTLRLYNPSDRIIDAPGEIALPEITRLTCRGEAAS